MIFLDSGDVTKIEKYANVISGVTTNPTIMKRSGIKDVREFVDIVSDYQIPISLEITTNSSVDEMIAEGERLASLSQYVNVKVPIHGPYGELLNLEVIKELSMRGIDVNVTAMMSAQQCFIANELGARYLSLFGGRINDMGHSAIEEIKKTVVLLRRRNIFPIAEIIIGSVREASNVIDWLVAGANIVTVTPELIDKIIIHPFTKETVQMFLKDAANA